jgi:protoheme IX farnesyltransferase
VPSGLVQPREALFFGLTLSLIAVLTLAVTANLLAAGLLAFTIFFYAVIYTMWLKRATPQNIVIGGAAGALPPVVGYAAATGSVTLDSLVLFAIIFIWTPPHFWALALVKSGEYERAGVPMMPNVKGADHTRLEIVLYTLLLAAVAVAPWPMGVGAFARARRPIALRCNCSAFRFCTFSCFSPLWWSSTAWVLSIVLACDSHDGTRTRSRNQADAGATAKSALA